MQLNLCNLKHAEGEKRIANGHMVFADIIATNEYKWPNVFGKPEIIAILNIRHVGLPHIFTNSTADFN